MIDEKAERVAIGVLLAVAEIDAACDSILADESQAIAALACALGHRLARIAHDSDGLLNGIRLTGTSVAQFAIMKHRVIAAERASTMQKES